MLRIAISGFGRIGRNFLRCLLQDEIACEKIDIVAINIGPAEKEFIAHMFKYDTLMGTFAGDVSYTDNQLVINNKRIEVLSEVNPECIDWAAYTIDWVVEASGCFTKRDGAMKHIKAGAKHVLISAPAKEEDISIIPGVNEQEFDRENHKIVSLGSCTTNAIMPILKVLNDTFEIVQGSMTTVHAYTNSQVLLDKEDHDLRRSRAAALNIIPTTTGAMRMLSKLMPSLENRIHGVALRVPVAKVSLIDFAFTAQKDMTATAINEAFIKTSKTSMKGIVDVTMQPLVSCDFGGADFSVVIDGLLTFADGRFAKVFGWYDNEWGYSVRLKDFLVYVNQL